MIKNAQQISKLGFCSEGLNEVQNRLRRPDFRIHQRTHPLRLETTGIARVCSALEAIGRLVLTYMTVTGTEDIDGKSTFED